VSAVRFRFIIIKCGGVSQTSAAPQKSGKVPAAPYTHRYEEDQMTQRDKRLGWFTIHIGLFGAALVFFAIGTFLVWNQQSGVPARVTVESCSGSSPTGHTRGPRSVANLPTCYGRPSGAPDQPLMKIWNGWWGDAGHDINVHILGSGNTATVTKDSWWQPLTALGIGCMFGAGAVSGIVRRRRRGRT
jgi:hypothetical protein